MWILFLIFSLLAGAVTILFIILAVMKKKHAILGLCISGGILLLSMGGFFISAGFAAFNSFVNAANEMSDDEYYDDDYYDVDLGDNKLIDDYSDDDTTNEIEASKKSFQGGEGKIAAGTYKIETISQLENTLSLK